MPHIDIDGVSLHYHQSGSGPDVVLVHAVTSNLALWLFTGLIDTLARDYRVTAYDLRGHGMSDAPPTGYTSAEMANEYLKLHDRLGLGPAVLVGHSFGAVVATHAALIDPQRVRGVILSDPYFPGLAHVEPNLGKANVWIDLRTTFAKAGVDLGEDVDFSTLFRIVSQLSTDQWAVIRTDLGPASARWLQQLPRLAETTCGADVFLPAGLTEDRLRMLRVPFVALYDEYSPFMATCRHLQAILPDCLIEFVPGAKHLAPVQNPTAFAELVRKHLTAMWTS